MPVADHPTPAVLGDQAGILGKQGLDLGFNRLLKQFAGAVAQEFGQRIVDRTWLRQPDNGILGYGVSLLSGRCGWLVAATVTPPPFSPPSPTFGHSSQRRSDGQSGLM
jgi:hypothetical protein